jgi:hypothetical protein
VHEKANEIWAPVPGTEYYEISTHGRYRSYRGYGGLKLSTPKMLKPRNSNGYRAVTIYGNGGKRNGRQTYIHILMLTAFVGPCPPGMEASHKDGNRSNNVLLNLEWKTHAANMKDKFIHGTTGKGEQNAMAILNPWKVEMIRFLHLCLPKDKRPTFKETGKIFNVCAAAIHNVISGKTWKT